LKITNIRTEAVFALKPRPGRSLGLLATLILFPTGVLTAGPTVPELIAVEQAMTNYMSSHGFQAGTIALMKNSKLVLRQGYGWRNSNLTEPIHPDNLFRLASISKTITGSAIRKLVNAGQLSTTTKVYSYLGIPPWGGTLGDTRITNITVQHLLDHAGGWNRDVSSVGDAVFSTITISSNLALSYPAAPSNVISWMFSKPLDFAPGASNVYSNFGYQLLGRVVEKASGKSYMDYLQQNLLGPLGITNVIQSRSRPSDLNPWEIWYADSPSLYRSAVDYPTNLFVRWADGGGYYESFDAFGGLSASALGLCQYMLSYWVAGAQRVPASSYTWGYVFYGSLPGTTTVIHQDIMQNSSTTNGLEFAVLFNRRTGGNDNDEAHTAIVNATTSVTSWPTNGGGMIQWNVAATNVSKNEGTVNVQLVRTGLSTFPVKVSYMTYGVTAGTTNYVPGAAIVSFAGGETNKNIAVTILNSGRIEPTKQFLLELLSASGGAWLGNRVSCAVNILDDSTPPVFLGEPGFTGSNFTAQISGATGLVMRVQYTTNFSNWITLQTLTNTFGSFNLIDNTAVNRPRSFYRVIVP
jgi:CubicO group peptidase (beta-lactamase class C family)